MATNNATHLSSTTQQYLDILDITNDLLIMKDGSAAIVMEVSAINFGLLSEPEQDAIIFAYAALINSLSFSIQIVISSRPKDVSVYLEYIDEQLQHAPTDLRRQQIASYRQFVANLITEQNVLDKKFYVVLSLSALELGVTGANNPINTLIPNNKPATFDKNALVERATSTLGPRRDHMLSQFGRFGLRAHQLTTKDLIHLFYILYNTQASEGAKIVDTREYTTAVIQTQSAAPAATVNAAPAPQFAAAPAPQALVAAPPAPTPLPPTAPISTPTSTPSAMTMPPTPLEVPNLPPEVQQPSAVINQQMSQSSANVAAPVQTMETTPPALTATPIPAPALIPIQSNVPNTFQQATAAIPQESFSGTPTQTTQPAPGLSPMQPR